MPDAEINVRYRATVLAAIVALSALGIAAVLVVALVSSGERQSLAFSIIVSLLAPTLVSLAGVFKAEQAKAVADENRQRLTHIVNGVDGLANGIRPPA